MAERELAYYVRQAWPLVEPTNRFIDGWHVHAICDHLEAVTRGEIRNLLINIPPRCMKSTLVCVMWPTWEWTTKPATRWLFSSYADSLAVRDSLKCRRIIQSQWYQENWGDVFQLTGDQNQKTRFENDKTGYRWATGVGGGATGEGGDRLVSDDPIKAMDAHSAAARQAVITWWDETMSTRLNNPEKSARVVIMQRLHEQDLSGHILAKMAEGGVQYEHLCLPMEYEPRQYVSAIGWQDPRTEPGELLWPERFTKAGVAAIKADLGSYGTAGQLQQRPAPAGGGMLKRVWWRFWVPRGVKLSPVVTQLEDGTLFEHPQVELPESFEEMLQSWDMTFKDTKQSDFVCGQVWAKQGADRFLLDQVLERMDMTDTLKAVEAISQKWPKTHAKLVEDKANGPAVISMLRHKLTGLIAVNPQGGKEARVAASAPTIESGNVYLPHPRMAPWVEAFLVSAASFPNAAHDDDIDAMTQALIRWGGRTPKVRAA